MGIYLNLEAISGLVASSSKPFFLHLSIVMFALSENHLQKLPILLHED